MDRGTATFKRSECGKRFSAPDIEWMASKIICNPLLCVSFVLLTICVSCKDKAKKTVLTEKEAMEYFINHTPEQGAFFYSKNREEYPFLDKLYMDSIYPAIVDCNYYELKKIFANTKGTPITEDLKVVLDNAKFELEESIFEELENNSQFEQTMFQEEIVPIMDLGLDSIIHSDIEKVVEEYAGGFMNYKKLYFFAGKDYEDFKKIWAKHISHEKYADYVKEMATNYLRIICENKSEYIKNVTERDVSQRFDLQIQTIEFEISDDVINYVQEFTSKEKSEITRDAIKDWIAPVAIGMLTGGVGSAIYEIGVTGYDIKVTIDDIKAQKMDSNDMLMYICEEDIQNQVKEHYLDLYTEQILMIIQEINQQTRFLIECTI